MRLQVMLIHMHGESVMQFGLQLFSVVHDTSEQDFIFTIFSPFCHYFSVYPLILLTRYYFAFDYVSDFQVDTTVHRSNRNNIDNQVYN